MTLVEIIRWAAASFLALLGTFLVIGNLACLIGACRSRSNTSFLLFIGGLSLAASFLTFPIDGLWRYTWVPFVVDITYPLAAIALSTALFSWGVRKLFKK